MWTCRLWLESGCIFRLREAQQALRMNVSLNNASLLHHVHTCIVNSVLVATTWGREGCTYSPKIIPSCLPRRFEKGREMEARVVITGDLRPMPSMWYYTSSN